MFRSLFCSQSIRQRIRRRTVTLYFNFQLNSQILVHRSQPDLTSFHCCAKLRLSNAQCCQALKRRSRFHSVVTDLSHHSRRVLPRDWVASRVAVHEDCGLVSMLLVFEISAPLWAFPTRYRAACFNGTESNSRGSILLWAKCFAVSARSNLSWAKYESLIPADQYLVAPSLFRIGLRLPPNTGLSCSFPSWCTYCFRVRIAS